MVEVPTQSENAERVQSSSAVYWKNLCQIIFNDLANL